MIEIKAWDFTHEDYELLNRYMRSEYCLKETTSHDNLWDRIRRSIRWEAIGCPLK